jgi:transposase-like protein
MPMRWSPEVQAKVQRLVERTSRSYAEIEAETGVPGTTARYWTRTRGWTRPRSAPARRRFPADESAAIARALAAGARVHDVAIIAGRHPETIRKLCPHRREAGAADAAYEREPVPAPVAALCETLMAGGIGRDELLRHAPQAFGFVMAQALMGRDPQVDRTAKAVAQLAASAAKMPAAATVHDDPYAGPQSFEETNALLEEFAIRLDEWDEKRRQGLLDEPAASSGSLIDPPAPGAALLVAPP